MGLDVYLRHYENFNDAQRREAEYEKQSNELWAAAGPYESLADDQKETLRTKLHAIAAELDLDEYGSAKNRAVERPSRLYPDHLFKVGYFRSSYNEGGFNNVMPPLCGVGLYEIFDRKESDEYEWQPDWASARANAIAALEKARASIAEHGGYRVARFAGNMFINPQELPTSSEEAMKIFLRETARKKSSEGTSLESYSNRDGEFFFGGPLEVVAVIHGYEYRQPTQFAIYKAKDLDWYLQALEIVIETCEYVQDRPDKDKYYLAWSS